MTVIVTGFEPFGTSRTNSSGLLVAALHALEEPSVFTAILPTSYRRAEARMLELLHAHRPATVLMLGLSSEAVGLRLERVARNLDDCESPDNDGEVRLRRTIVEHAPPSYRSSLPLRRMAETARHLHEDAAWSDDAGSYVCNHVFFTAAHWTATQLPASRCGFVHLPALEESGDRLTRLLEIVRRWIVEF